MGFEESVDSPPAKRVKVDIDKPLELEEPTKLDSDVVEDNSSKSSIVEDYTNFVTPEEVQKLKEFKVLDEVKSNDEDSENEDSESSEEIPEEEIEKMLDEELPENYKKGPKKPKAKPYVTGTKIVLEEKGINHFEVLPLDWITVNHISGMPMYMHRTSRVCTLSKPYFLGKGNSRRHEIPISAIPCLAYRKALEEEEKQKEIDKIIQEQIKNKSWEKKTTCPAKIVNISIDKNVTLNNKDVSCDKTPESNSIESNSIMENAMSSKCTFSKKTKLNKCDKTNVSIKDCLIKKEAISNVDTSRESVNNQDNKNNQICDKNIDMANNKTDNQTESGSVEKTGNSDINESEVSTDEKKPTYSDNQIESITDDDKIDDASKATNETEDNTEPEKEIPLNQQPVVLPGGIVMPPPKVETVNTSWKTQHLTPEAVNDYCKKLFKFKTISVMHFMSWAERRNYQNARKALQYPTLPPGTKLITIPQAQGENGGKSAKRDWVMDMNGPSYLSVFHEYVRRALQKQPVYEFKQLENASSPYQATVFIGGMQYGVGVGSSKRQAKAAAARASIQVLIPEMREHINDNQGNNTTEPDFSFFDYVGIEDPRISEFCAATCEPSPHAILKTCLLRNFGAGERHIHTEMKKLEYQKIELTMKVGKHSATVVCKNKKTAKQRASQAILQALHPHVVSWGSLLRLYGPRSVKSCKEKKLEEQQITLLQDQATHNQPNYAVLEKLRHEMRKLRERDEAVVPIGTLLVREELPSHSGSNLNNVDL